MVLRVRALALALAVVMLGALLAPVPQARAEVFTGTVVKFSERLGTTITLPDAKVGVFHTFKVVDDAGRTVPLVPRGQNTYDSTSQTFVTHVSLYYTSPGRRVFDACQPLNPTCVTVVQDVTGTKLAGTNKLMTIRQQQDGWIPGGQLTVVPTNVNLSTGKLYVQWYRDFLPIPGATASTYTIGPLDYRQLVGGVALHIVPGSRPAYAQIGHFRVVGDSVALGDVTGDGLADFHVFTGEPDFPWQQQVWFGTRAGRATLGPTRRSDISNPRLTVQAGSLGNGGYTETWAIVRSTDGVENLISFEMLGAGEMGATFTIGRNWKSIDALVPVNGANNRVAFALARNRSTGALMRYLPTRDAEGLMVLGRGAQVGSNWNSMKFLLSPGDVTGDGVPDLMAVKNDGTLWQYKLNSNGTVASTRQVGHGWSGFTHVFSPGDLTGDGRPDIVGRRADGTVVVYANKVGSWGTPRVLITGLSKVVLMA